MKTVNLPPSLSRWFFHELINLFEVIFFMYKMRAITIRYQNTGKEAKEKLILKFKCFSPHSKIFQHLENIKHTVASNLWCVCGGSIQKATNHLLMALAIQPTPAFCLRVQRFALCSHRGGVGVGRLSPVLGTIGTTLWSGRVDSHRLSRHRAEHITSE